MNEELKAKFASAINGLSREQDSNTPDFILAEYLLGCLDAFELASNRREAWYGVENKPHSATKAKRGRDKKETILSRP